MKLVNLVSVVCFFLTTTIAQSKERVFASFYPLEYVLETLTEGELEVWNPVDSDPAEWKPSKSDIAKIQKSKLIFINGAGFESGQKLFLCRDPS